MLRYAVVVSCILLVCAGEMQIPRYNLSVSNLYSGQWFVEVRLEHDNDQLWNLNVGHSADTTVAKIIPPNKDSKLQPVTKGKKLDPSYRSLINPEFELVPEVGYYKVYKPAEKRTWIESKNECERTGTHLAVINSELEAWVLGNLISRHNLTGWGNWIGLHDQNNDGKYVTIFNETLGSTGFSTWAHGRPRGENCAVFVNNPHIHLFGLYDDNCDNERPFICEHEIF